MKSTKKIAIEEDGKMLINGKKIKKERYMRNIRYQNQYNKKRYRQFAVKFVNGKDDEIINFLVEKPNLTAYIKGLIEDDISQRP